MLDVLNQFTLTDVVTNRLPDAIDRLTHETVSSVPRPGPALTVGKGQ